MCTALHGGVRTYTTIHLIGIRHGASLKIPIQDRTWNDNTPTGNVEGFSIMGNSKQQHWDEINFWSNPDVTITHNGISYVTGNNTTFNAAKTFLKKNRNWLNVETIMQIYAKNH